VRILADHGLHRARALRGGLDAWLEIEAATPLVAPAAGLEQDALAPLAVLSESAP